MRQRPLRPNPPETLFRSPAKSPGRPVPILWVGAAEPFGCARWGQVFRSWRGGFGRYHVMAKDFLPTKDDALLAWSVAFAEKITATPTSFGLSAAQATAYN